MQFEPIGYFHGDSVYKQEVPRQGVFFEGHCGRIELLPSKNFETALRNLDGFERIWVLFQFHKNDSWRPTTRPPVITQGLDRVGVFASRSPYRPNPIGMSCVKLLRIEKLSLFVDEADLLDATPVLDIKPYIPKADAFLNVRAGWADCQGIDVWNIFEKESFKYENTLLVSLGGPDLGSFGKVQLSNNPFDSSRKRITLKENGGILSFRVFRISFSINKCEKIIYLEHIYSGYTESELLSDEDKYLDKNLHRAFVKALSYATKNQ